MQNSEFCQISKPKTHLNEYYRGAQNKRNTYKVLISAILIFSEISKGDNSGIFSKSWKLLISPWSPMNDSTMPMWCRCNSSKILYFFFIFGILKSKTKSKLFQLKSKKSKLFSTPFRKVKVKVNEKKTWALVYFSR